MLIKLGVDISRLERNTRRSLAVVDKVVTGWSGKEAVVTSTYEGNHSPSSLHYADRAYDIRRYKLLAEDFDGMLAELRDRLKGFDVVLEEDHIHIEYDPVYPSPDA